MADTTTTNYGLTKPEIGASEDTWGAKLNTDMDLIDTQMKSSDDVSSAALPKTGGIMTGIIAGFESTGIDDNASSTKVTVSDTGIDITGGITATTAPSDTSFPLTAYHPTGTAARTIARFQSNIGGTATDKVVIKADGSVTTGSLDVTGTVTATKLKALNAGGTAPAEVDIVSGGTWRLRSNPTSGTNAYGMDIVKGSAGTDVKLSINSSGSVLVGRTTSGRTGNGHSIRGGDSAIFSRDAAGETVQIGRNAVDGDLVRFYSNGTQTGSIGTVSGTSTSYNTSSDYRLKTNVLPMTGATATFMQLKPCNFEWISSGERVDGFLAHELGAVIPASATGTHNGMMDEEYEVSPATGDIYTAGSDAGFTEVSPEVVGGPAYYDINGVQIRAEIIAESAVHEAFDAVDEVIHSSDVEQPETLEDGQAWRETTPQVMATRSVPDMQGIDQSKIVPLLVATLQEALARIEALEE